MRAFIFCLALAACSTGRVPFTSYSAGPAVAPPSVSDTALIEATRTVFEGHGLELAQDDGSGVIVSAPQRVNGRTLHAWRAVVREGSLQLEIDCFVETSAGRQACEGTARAQPWQEKAPKLRADIFAEAERLAAGP
jgi:hypothetical protein